MEELIKDILKECYHYRNDGTVPNYIPELAKANIDSFGMCIVEDNGRICSAGDYNDTFTIQSIIKPIILLLALMDKGIDSVRKLVGVEATGKPFDAFNYSDQALKCEHINPMINTGAIALCTLIKRRNIQRQIFTFIRFDEKIGRQSQVRYMQRGVFVRKSNRQ